MKISARNLFSCTMKSVNKRTATAHVQLDVGAYRGTASLGAS